MIDVKRAFVGPPLRSAGLVGQLLPKRLALPVFCSDPLSSVAYATQQILAVLALGGLALTHLAPWIGGTIVLLLVIVVASYRQTCFAYPSGGGAYVVSRENLGARASLVAAGALMVDYVLTVAVSVVAGVDAITSYAPGLNRHAVGLSVALVALLAVVNLRGLKESGRGFAVPTYAFVAGIYAMFAVAAVRLLDGGHLRAVSADYGVRPEYHHVTGLLAAALVLRAFASGCTALTGVEAVSNGVPAFRPPKSRNAAGTLAAMGVLATTMFAGITVLAVVARVHYADDPGRLIGAPASWAEPTALAQVAEAVFGHGIVFALLQAATAAILVLAANTAFNGFPVLTSILARDGYLPRQFHTRGDRLVFSNGIIVLALAAGGLILAFQAGIGRLLQLYIIGVFVSFTLSQAGMVRHWHRELARGTAARSRAAIRRAQAINALGAVVTGAVLVIVLATKFMHGAWIVCIAVPALYWLMGAIRQHYDSVRDLTPPGDSVTVPSGNHAIVLVSRLNAPVTRALGYAKSMRPATLTALAVRVDPEETAALRAAWEAHGIDVPLVVLDSPYREITRPVIDYVRRRYGHRPHDVTTVVIPEYVVGRWREQFLHNQSALRIKGRLLFCPGVVVVSVPYLLRSGHDRAHRPDTGDRDSLLLRSVRRDLAGPRPS
ncbi:APC family permease [Actinomadura sp. KC216]|uniref:APC family permease n=1 Tax=Actinomadura sp. KC216 TaxID=2530370 RepID=UPI00104D884B|nr:APC family permease [Actinomadura sp. KC216]TDB83045.1 APC family permease [Actinomadura sp. KC216]